MRSLTFPLIFLMAQLLAAEEVKMKNENVLIVYGSYAGSTAEIAAGMEKTLKKANCTVNTVPADSKKMDLSKYALVIIGSAIHGGNPHENVLAFIESNRAALAQKKTAVFAVCITITSKKENRRKDAQSYPDKVCNGLSPISKAVFAGKAPSSGWFGNMIGNLMLGIEPGDYRDWNKINSWTESLAQTL